LFQLQSIGCIPVKYQVAHGQGLSDREKACTRLNACPFRRTKSRRSIFRW